MYVLLPVFKSITKVHLLNLYSLSHGPKLKSVCSLYILTFDILDTALHVFFKKAILNSINFKLPPPKKNKLYYLSLSLNHMAKKNKDRYLAAELSIL